MYLLGHPREFEALRNDKGCSVICLKILDAIERFTKVSFSYSSLYHISENFRFHFSTKISLTWGVKCETLSFRNRREFFR